MDLRNTLAQRFRLDLPATLMFDYPTVAALGQFIVKQLSGGEETTERPQAPAPASGIATWQPAELTESLQAMVAEVLGSEVPPNQPLMEAGLDSLGKLTAGGPFCCVQLSA